MTTIDQEAWVQAELAPKISDVRRLQEILCLSGRVVSIDGILGPATRAAILATCKELGSMGQDGEPWVADMVSKLTMPMWDAINRRRPREVKTFRDAVRHVATGYLEAGAREVPGSNRGPWVRIFSRGTEGLPWCGSFVAHVLRQAGEMVKLPPPIAGSPDCDVIAAQARKAGRFVDGIAGSAPAGVAPGDLMLMQRSASDWFHTGVVTEISPEHVACIEGNTNSQGSPEGIEVRMRYRRFGPALDFVRLD